MQGLSAIAQSCVRRPATRSHATRSDAITQPCALQELLKMKVAPEVVQGHVLQLNAKLTNAGESLFLDLSTEEGS